ncbi:MAG TPA: rhodanese-like domain-containing protein [Steroidobacteraceae bacterium]|nr:rhodanese-like domain-containing protein [Steroidobacteraceae bacterium]
MTFNQAIVTVAACLLVAATVAGDRSPKSISPDALSERLSQGEQAPIVLDVRSPEEFVTGHVPGAVNIPFDQVAGRLAEIPKDKDLVLYCRSGRRAGIAADVLVANGYAPASLLEGDIAGWQGADLPVERPADAAACVAALQAARDVEKACAPPAVR